MSRISSFCLFNFRTLVLITFLITFRLPCIEKTSKIMGFREQITGIEPASPAWEAGVLPMNYICM